MIDDLDDTVIVGEPLTVGDATDTYDCKTPGCLGVAKASRGAYAFLCPRCIETKRASFAESIRKGVEKRAAPATSNGTVAALPATRGPLAAIAERIGPAIDEMERALVERRTARREAQRAMATLNGIVGELRAAIAAFDAES